MKHQVTKLPISVMYTSCRKLNLGHLFFVFNNEDNSVIIPSEYTNLKNNFHGNKLYEKEPESIEDNTFFKYELISKDKLESFIEMVREGYFVNYLVKKNAKPSEVPMMLSTASGEGYTKEYDSLESALTSVNQDKKTNENEFYKER